MLGYISMHMQHCCWQRRRFAYYDFCNIGFHHAAICDAGQFYALISWAMLGWPPIDVNKKAFNTLYDDGRHIEPIDMRYIKTPFLLTSRYDAIQKFHFYTLKS